MILDVSVAFVIFTFRGATTFRPQPKGNGCLYICPYTSPRHAGSGSPRMSAPSPTLIHNERGRNMEIYLIIALMGTLALFWGILWLTNDPLEEGFREAQAWEKRQKRLREILPQ